METLPVCLNMEGKRCLLVGGGRAAYIKLKTLLDFGCQVAVVAETASPDFLELAAAHGVQVTLRRFLEADLAGCFLVVCACSEEANRAIYECAKQKGALCAVCGGGRGDFIFPAYKRQGGVTAAVTTNGRFPLLAKTLCEGIELGTEEALSALSEKREWLKAHCKDAGRKRELMLALVKEGMTMEELKRRAQQTGDRKSDTSAEG